MLSFAECHFYSIIFLSVILDSVFLPRGFLLNVILLNVMAPDKDREGGGVNHQMQVGK
jgi:hypothetical protein